MICVNLHKDNLLFHCYLEFVHHTFNKTFDKEKKLVQIQIANVYNQLKRMFKYYVTNLYK
jgi:hypothetical protein